MMRAAAGMRLYGRLDQVDRLGRSRPARRSGGRARRRAPSRPADSSRGDKHLARRGGPVNCLGIRRSPTPSAHDPCGVVGWSWLSGMISCGMPAAKRGRRSCRCRRGGSARRTRQELRKRGEGEVADVGRQVRGDLLGEAREQDRRAARAASAGVDGGGEEGSRPWTLADPGVKTSGGSPAVQVRRRRRRAPAGRRPRVEQREAGQLDVRRVVRLRRGEPARATGRRSAGGSGWLRRRSCASAAGRARARSGSSTGPTFGSIRNAVDDPPHRSASPSAAGTRGRSCPGQRRDLVDRAEDRRREVDA